MANFDPSHCSTISRGPTNCKKGTQRGPNFEQKGDLFEVKGTQNSNFSELFTKSEYVKMVKKSQFCFQQQAVKQLTGLHF